MFTNYDNAQWWQRRDLCLHEAIYRSCAIRRRANPRSDSLESERIKKPEAMHRACYIEYNVYSGPTGGERSCVQCGFGPSSTPMVERWCFCLRLRHVSSKFGRVTPPFHFGSRCKGVCHPFISHIISSRPVTSSGTRPSTTLFGFSLSASSIQSMPSFTSKSQTALAGGKSCSSISQAIR